MSIQKVRSRKWGLLLYMEDSTHKEAFEKLMELDGCSCSVAYIVHDKDVDESTGELKKEHIHVVLDWKNSVWNTALAKQLGIKENYIQQIRNYENALEYLIHYNDNEKYQYNIDEVQGTLKQKLAEIIAKDGMSEGERVLQLYEYINNYDGVIKISDVLKWSAKNGFWDIFRRSSTIFMAVIQEHNEALSKKINKYRKELNKCKY